jgi:23S rRNA (adenine1618-N6)-methyltransferase
MTNKTTLTKGSLHPRNLHHERYDLKRLCQASAQLREYIITNPKGELTIDFGNSDAVLALNQALLNSYYHIGFWQIPDGYLCPPIPGRADYIHYLADLLAEDAGGSIPRGKQIKVLDIGTGANCIYPILGSQIYNWSFVATDIDPLSLKTAELIVRSNKNLQPYIKLRLQKEEKSIFDGVIKPQDQFAITLCNPPFHASMEKAYAGSARKVSNLNKGGAGNNELKLNFGGQKNELCCAGGEIAFLKQMCKESKNYTRQVHWFTSLVSKSENVPLLKKLLIQLSAKQIKVIKMSQGQKTSRLLAWRFR